MSRLPPLAALRAFEAAGRHENFSRAAEELGMSQAAISYQVRQLEDRVGKPLFVREKGRVKLSEIGQRLLPSVSGGFAEIAEAFDALRDDDAEVLSINAAMSIGAAWLSSRIGRFQVRHPDIAVRLSLSNQLIDFSSGQTDIALRAGRGDWDGLRSEFLFRQHFAPICSPSFIDAHRIAKPEDLLRVERLTPNDQIWNGWFAAAGLEIPPPARFGVVMDSQMQEASSIAGGFGIGMLTPLYWRNDIATGRLAQPFDTLFVAPTSHFLVHRAGRVGVRKIERFREWLHDELAEERLHSPAEIWETPA